MQCPLFFLLIFFFVLELAGIGHGDLLGAFARLGSVGLDLLDDVHALHHLAEDHVLAVQPAGLGRADEELRAVGAGACEGEIPIG